MNSLSHSLPGILGYHIKIYCIFDLIKKHPPEAEIELTSGGVFVFKVCVECLQTSRELQIKLD